MRNPQGYAIITADRPADVNFGFRRDTAREGITEIDTFTCGHCNTVVHVKPKMPMDEFGSMCRRCMKMTCPRCADLGCTPFEKKLEMKEARDRALRSYGL